MKRFICVFMVVVTMLSGCSKGINEEEQHEDKKNEFKYPKVENALLTDLGNCDVTFLDNMPYYDFEFSLMSPEKLDEDKIDIKFDADMPYEWVINDVRVEKKEEKFGYSLFCAYNGYKLENMGTIDEISEDDYKDAILNNPEVKNWYVYDVCTEIDVEAIKQETDTETDTEINQMTVSYGEESYVYDIGRIVVDLSKKCNTKFGEDFAGDESCYQASNGLDYLPLENSKDGVWDASTDSLIVTQKKGMKIDSVQLSNVKDVELQGVEVIVTNEQGTVQFEYEEGKSIDIPKDSEVSLIAHLKSDVLSNSTKYYISPIINVKYTVDGKKGEFDFPILARLYYRTAFEIYAVDVDNVDIFNLYLNNIEI